MPENKPVALLNILRFLRKQFIEDLEVIFIVDFLESNRDAISRDPFRLERPCNLDSSPPFHSEFATGKSFRKALFIKEAFSDQVGEYFIDLTAMQSVAIQLVSYFQMRALLISAIPPDFVFGFLRADRSHIGTPA